MPVTRTMRPPLSGGLSPGLAPARAMAIPTTSRSGFAPSSGGRAMRAPLSSGFSGSSSSSWGNITPAAAPKPKGGFAGLLHNAGSMVHGFIPGVAHFIGNALEDATFVPHALFDVARGKFQLNAGDFQKYLPATTGIVKSLGHTAGDIVNPMHFVKAWKEGDLLSKIVEDVGNVALIGGPAAKLIGSGAAVSAMTAEEAAAVGAREATAGEVARAGLPETVEPAATTAAEGAAKDLTEAATEPKAYYTRYRGLAGRAAEAGDWERAAQLNQIANTVEKVTHLGGETIGNAPAVPYKLIGKGIAKVAGLDGGLVEGLMSHLPEDVKWRTGAGKTVRQIRSLATATRVRLTRDATEGAQLSKRFDLTQAEDRAALVSLEIPADNLGILDHLDEHQLHDFLNEKFSHVEESQRPTVEDARVASQYAQRSLPADKLAQIDAVQRKVADFVDQRTGRAVLAGLPAEHLAPTLKPSEVAKVTAELAKEHGRVSKRLATVTGIFDRLDRNRRVQDVLAKDLPAPTAMDTAGIRSSLEAKQGQLADANQAYEEAMARGTDQQKLAAGAKVDVLLDDTEKLKTQAGWIRPQRFSFTGGKDPETGRPLGDYRDTGNPSTNERIRMRQGTLAERANAAKIHVDRVQRRLDTLQGQMGNVENDLGRTFQDRFHTDVNLPHVQRMTNAMFRGTKRLATLVRQHAPGVDLKGMSVDDMARLVDTRTLSPADRAAFEHSLAAEHAASRIGDVMETETAAGRKLNSPYRVKDVIDQTELPDAARRASDDAWSRYSKQSFNTLHRTFNKWTEAIPARFRTAAQDGQRQVAALMKLAEDSNRDVPGSGDQFLKLANDTMTTIKEMTDAGFDPKHLIGGKEVTSTGGGALYGAQRLTEPKMRAQSLRRTGLRQLSTDAYAKVETNQAAKWVEGKRNSYLAETLGKKVSSFPEVQSELAAWDDRHPGETMPPLTLANVVAKVKDEHGLEYVPTEPSATMTPDTTVVPRKIFESFAPAGQMNMGWRMLARSNKAFKTWVLPFSPRWQVGNAIGNVLQAHMHADVGPVELARQMVAMTRREGQGSLKQGIKNLWADEGQPGMLPTRISDSGLSQGERDVLGMGGDQEITGRNRASVRMQKIARGSYRFNSFVDNMTRSSVYLAKLGDGEGSDAALQTTLRSMGDYTNMTPFERTKVRNVLPFYAWLKHSITATLRLPITSPTRAAFYMNLQNLYQQDPDLQKLIGQRFQIGGTSLLNIGTAVPFADIDSGSSLLNPKNWGTALAPGIKTAAAVLGGWDLNRMDRITRPAGQFSSGPFGKENTTPLERLFTHPLQGAGEIGWQLTQEGPSQIRSLRDAILGDTTRYSGTGYRTPYTNPNNRNPWQIARILSLPSVQYEPRLKTGK